MTIESDPATQAINDARALLDTLLASGWQELHVVSGDTEIFLARQGGGANPMRVAPAPVSVQAPVPTQAAPGAVAIAPAAETVVTAPHVATLVDALAPGEAVKAGQTIATLRVLDETETVEAPVAGTIVRVEAAAGDLLDYGAPLLCIAEVA